MNIDLNYTDTTILIEALRKNMKPDGSHGKYSDRLLERLSEHKVATYNDNTGNLPDSTGK